MGEAMTLTNAIEVIGERFGVRHATLALRVESDADVTAMYESLGHRVDDTGARKEGEVPPRWEWTTDKTARWLEAAVTVAGVRVIVSGPMVIERKAA